jgi:histidinol-phosphate phosphatase family protein
MRVDGGGVRLLINAATLTPPRGVDAASPAALAATRMRNASLGLALRGHDVTWIGAEAPPEARAQVRVRTAAFGLHERMDLVLGGPWSPARTAVAGWWARVHGMVLALDPPAVHRWSLADRWAWGSLDHAGLLDAAVEYSEAELAGEPVARIDRWPAADSSERADVTHPDTDALERTCERVLARRSGHAPRPAAFLDRDGTLVLEKGYLAHADDLELLPGVVAGLRRLRALGCALVVVSNQSGVGRGFFPLARVYEAMARLRRELRVHGIELDAIYFCPHRPDAGCECRKPSPQLLRDAARNLRIALKRSVMIGDKQLDAATGRAAGARGILVRTGYGRDEEARGFDRNAAPTAIVDDLESAAAWLAEYLPEE